MEEKLFNLSNSGDILFLLIGAILVFFMHGGFAFLELGTVRKKSQVNALVKIISDFAASTFAYFLIGFPIAYGINFLHPAKELLGSTQGYDLIHFFFLLTFAAAVPAIISGGIAERAKFYPQFSAGIVIVAFVYPFFESLAWGRFSELFNGFFTRLFGAGFHDYAGSIVVHSIGGWLALPAVIILGPRIGRYLRGRSNPIPVSSIPWLSLGSWILSVGWFGFNVMSAGKFTQISGLVAVNSLMAMAGGILFALFISKKDPGFVHNGALAGLIAICAGSDIVHPLAAFFIGGVGASIFVFGFQYEQEKLKIDDVLGVWPLHGVTGTWGGIAAGIFGYPILGGAGGINFFTQITVSLLAAVYALIFGVLIYKLLAASVGIRLNDEEEFNGADLTIHKIHANPEQELTSKVV